MSCLDELFVHQTSEESCKVLPYTDRLDRIAGSCPDANIVQGSLAWSRLSAIQAGDCTIHERAELDGETLPFDPSTVAVQITYQWDGVAFDLAWVAIWPYRA
jgi:hypothetical protein